jgi:hypothetical protein
VIDEVSGPSYTQGPVQEEAPAQIVPCNKRRLAVICACLVRIHQSGFDASTDINPYVTRRNPA